MLLRRIIFLLFLPVALEIFIACCQCEAPTIQSYTNKNISLANLDNSGETPVTLSSASVNKNAYGIRITFNREQTALNEFHVPTGLFISQACATKCDCPPALQFTPKDSIVSVRIIALYEFDEKHPPFSDITSFFGVYKSEGFSTYKQLLEGLNTTVFSESQLQTSADLLLMSPPADSSTQQFKVILKLSDGRELHNNTSPVYLY